MEGPSKEKTIVLIRHGLSYMNEYIGANGIAFGGPNFTDIFPPHDRETFYRDSPLSPTGQEQAKELGETIAGMLLPQDGRDNFFQDLELVVVSPLTRAIQTAQLALRLVKPSIPAIALPLAAERLYLVSDIGRPRAELETKYGHWMDFQAGFPQDEWWYRASTCGRQTPLDATDWRPTGQGQEYFCPGEPYHVFQRRMQDLCEWLDQRPESTIALVGHFGVFEWLLQGQDGREKVTFSNCEMRVVSFDSIKANACRRRGQ